MRRPTWAKWVTRVSLVLGLIALIYTIEDLGPRTFGHYFRMIGPWWIAVLVFEVAITSLDALAIRAFASPDTIGWRGALLAQLAGRSVNAVTPSGNLGEPVKISPRPTPSRSPTSRPCTGLFSPTSATTGYEVCRTGSEARPGTHSRQTSFLHRPTASRP